MNKLMKRLICWLTLAGVCFWHPMVLAGQEQNTKPIKVRVIQVLSRLMKGWDAGDATAFAAPFAEDSDFVPYFGEHIHGRKAIANAHQPVFDGFLKGSKLHYKLQAIRSVSKDVYLVHTLGAVTREGDATSEPTPTAIQSFVMVDKSGELIIEAFQNTLIGARPGPPVI